jgi:uncharacterized zinc-type alcohol dehydrogenase-like protein
MYSYKLRKYKSKISQTHDQNKIAFYERKIDYYSNIMIGGRTIMKPRKPHSDIEYIYYGSIQSIDQLANIKARGYGKLNKKNMYLEPVVFERRDPYSVDVVIKILYTGVCHSDLHVILGEWDSNVPLIPGHEICGIVVSIGSKVNNFSVGDLVAVGPFINSCRICNMCIHHHEQYCENGATAVYDSIDRKPGEIIATGEPTYGGFSSMIVVNKDFVFHVPKKLNPAKVAPLLCAGITTFSPLKQFGVEKPPNTMRVGVAGIGGLGHIAIKIAKAMGAYVIALTQTKWKLDDAINNLGADKSILVTHKKEMKEISESLDLIIDTIPVKHDLNMYLELLEYNGTLWILGPFTPLEYDMNILASKNRSIKSSVTGSRNETKEMLEFCSKHHIEADIEIIPINKINETYDRINNSDIKYRFVIDMKQ